MKYLFRIFVIVLCFKVSVSFPMNGLKPETVHSHRNDLSIDWKFLSNLRSKKDFMVLKPRRATLLQASPLLLPSMNMIALACLAPTSLGYIRYEYGVSYGYGSSVAIVASLLLRQLSFGTTAYWHAVALIFYGIRLNLFLLYREIFIERFRKFRDQIEKSRSASNGNGKALLSRSLFVVSCATLYACLAAPLFVTCQGVASNVLVKVCVGLTWAGFIVAALGDLQKSFIKGVLGEDVLVKGALFSRLRHPNYTGEVLAWSTSYLASIIVAISNWKASYIFPLLAGACGWIGIVVVLASAATGLEKKQLEKYSGRKEYDDWVKSSWAGPTWQRK